MGQIPVSVGLLATVLCALALPAIAVLSRRLGEYFDYPPRFDPAAAEALRQRLAGNAHLLAAHRQLTALDLAFAPLLGTTLTFWIGLALPGATLSWIPVSLAHFGALSDIAEDLLVWRVLTTPDVRVATGRAILMAVVTTAKFVGYLGAVGAAVVIGLWG